MYFGHPAHHLLLSPICFPFLFYFQVFLPMCICDPLGLIRVTCRNSVREYSLQHIQLNHWKLLQKVSPTPLAATISCQ